MASQPDEERITTCLIYDFFRAQFALKDAFFPLEEEDFHDSAIVESLEYRRTQEVLIQQGQIYIEQMHERISDQIQAFLAELHPPNEQNSFNSLSAHIFSHGIEWNLILTYFVFCAELAYQADLRRLASVRDIVLWMAQYTNQHLLPWIVDHGGWKGLSQLHWVIVNRRFKLFKKCLLSTGAGLVALVLFQVSKCLFRRFTSPHRYLLLVNGSQAQPQPTSLVNWFLAFNWLSFGFSQ